MLELYRVVYLNFHVDLRMLWQEVNFLFLLPGCGFLNSLVSFSLYRSIDYTATVKIDRLESLKLYGHNRQSYLGATSFLLFFFFILQLNKYLKLFNTCLCGVELRYRKLKINFLIFKSNTCKT